MRRKTLTDRQSPDEAASLKKRSFLAIALAACLFSVSGTARAAQAETGDCRVVLQFGIGYLPLAIMKHSQLVEKRLKAAGLPQTKVIWSQLASGQPMNDALLSGTLHVASGGVAPIEAMLNDPEIKITMTPEGTMRMAEFMNKVGTIKPKAASWRDLFFSEIHNLPGS